MSNIVEDEDTGPAIRSSPGLSRASFPMRLCQAPWEEVAALRFKSTGSWSSPSLSKEVSHMRMIS
ncbi:Hypothetical predicted protein [Scomber scombrus]|uniref:Uncharacterized protein n=1 Tax=Scomber scombrus TaxID=13677 RepID=A0AAV1NPJ9_SCOSC